MKTILAVDREERERQLLVEELEAEGYHVVAVASAKEALAIARRRMPDLVILELALPHANGIELIGRLIGINRKLPIIIHSACASYQENFMCWLADAYILKSAGFGELMAAIDRLLLGTAPDSLASPSFCYNGGVVAACPSTDARGRLGESVPCLTIRLRPRLTLATWRSFASASSRRRRISMA